MDNNAQLAIFVLVCIIADSIASSLGVIAISYCTIGLTVFGMIVKYLTRSNPAVYASIIEIIGFIVVLMSVIVFYSLVLHSASETTLFSPYLTSFTISLLVSNLAILILNSVLSNFVDGKKILALQS